MKIILASSSPRRREILEKYRLDLEVAKSHTEETIRTNEVPEQTAMTLAFHKALDVSKRYPSDIVIGADTIVVFNKEIIGKPKDKIDAFRILNILSGKTHKVITGVAIINIEKNLKVIDYETTKVKFKHLSDDRINKYIATNEPLDKAGAYGIQGLGSILVENIEGCYSNVVGLPLSKLDFLLNKFFNYNIL